MTNTVTPLTLTLTALGPLWDADEAETALADAFDRDFPGWEQREAGESARFVDESDVADAENGIVWGYGGDHRAYIPGAHE